VETKLKLTTEIATENKMAKINNVMYLLNVANHMKCFYELKRGKASGIDGVTMEDYEKNLGENIKCLVEKLKKWQYKPRPVKRVYIPKGNGKMRPLGIPAVEDK